EARRRAGWPPFSHLAMWRAVATDRKPVSEFLERVRSRAAARGAAIKVLGTAPAPMERKVGRYRMQPLLQARERSPLRALLAALLPEARGWREARRVRWSIDVDPIKV